MNVNDSVIINEREHDAFTNLIIVMVDSFDY